MQTSRFEARVSPAAETAVVELEGDVDSGAEAALEAAYAEATGNGARVVARLQPASDTSTRPASR